MTLSGRHCRILCAIFEEPTRANVKWDDFVSLCRALGAEFVKPGRTAGSQRRIKLNRLRAVLHEPHPRPEMKAGSVDSARAILRNAGVTPRKEGCEC